jgi:hypothetical protein
MPEAVRKLVTLTHPHKPGVTRIVPEAMARFREAAGWVRVDAKPTVRKSTHADSE